MIFHQGLKAVILGGIIEQVGKLEAASVANEATANTLDDDVVSSQPSVSTLDRLRPIQGTIMLHIVFAIKQDQVRTHASRKSLLFNICVQETGKELVKYIKSCPDLTSFAVALALSATRVQRFEDEIFDALKVILTRNGCFSLNSIICRIWSCIIFAILMQQSVQHGFQRYFHRRRMFRNSCWFGHTNDAIGF